MSMLRSGVWSVGRGRSVATVVAMAAALTASIAPRSARAMQGGAQATATSAPDSITPATVRGTVYDSVTHAPLAGAVVQLVETTHPGRALNATTDSLGAFTVSG